MWYPPGKLEYKSDCKFMKILHGGVSSASIRNEIRNAVPEAGMKGRDK